MVTAFEEQREEDMQKEIEKSKKGVAKYDPEDEKNKNTEAEIENLPCKFVDMKFVDQFKSFVTGKSKGIQPFYNEVNEEYLKKLNVKTFTLPKVEQAVDYFTKLERFNAQLTAIFKDEKFNSICVYNQKGSVSVFSFFDFEKMDKKI